MSSTDTTRPVCRAGRDLNDRRGACDTTGTWGGSAWDTTPGRWTHDDETTTDSFPGRGADAGDHGLFRRLGLLVARGDRAFGRTGTSGPNRVVLVGDSVAAGLALPMREALAAGGVRFRSLAADGGGAVVGPVSAQVWKDLPGDLAEATPDTVVYQITTYDWVPRSSRRPATGDC